MKEIEKEDELGNPKKMNDYNKKEKSFFPLNAPPLLALHDLQLVLYPILYLSQAVFPNKEAETSVLYISTSVWVLRTPNAGRMSHFQHFLCKKAEKNKKFAAKFCKKQFFLSLHCFIIYNTSDRYSIVFYTLDMFYTFFVLFANIQVCLRIIKVEDGRACSGGSLSVCEFVCCQLNVAKGAQVKIPLLPYNVDKREC